MAAITDPIALSGSHTAEKMKIDRERLDLEKAVALRRADEAKRLADSLAQVNAFVFQMGQVMSKILDKIG